MTKFQDVCTMFFIGKPNNYILLVIFNLYLRFECTICFGHKKSRWLTKMSITQIIVSLNYFALMVYFESCLPWRKISSQRCLISFLKNRALICHVFCNDESSLIWSRDALFYGDQLIGNVRWPGGFSEWWTHIAATELWLIPVSCAEVCIVGDWWCGRGPGSADLIY